jgi:hypothetical protein
MGKRVQFSGSDSSAPAKKRKVYEDDLPSDGGAPASSAPASSGPASSGPPSRAILRGAASAYADEHDEDYSKSMLLRKQKGELEASQGGGDAEEGDDAKEGDGAKEGERNMDEVKGEERYDAMYSLAADGVEIEAFNLKEEREGGGGYFDATGNYVFRSGNGGEEADAWLDGLEQAKGKARYGDDEEEGEREREEERELTDAAKAAM